jgi:hypothetical protein
MALLEQTIQQGEALLMIGDSRGMSYNDKKLDAAYKRIFKAFDTTFNVVEMILYINRTRKKKLETA